ncbi:MAG: hypothetical protein LBR23_08660, partial [Spirochaetaceae bacterium]|nr:hypothetical protein [Spirochaetaceae bacterium]
MRAKTLFGLKHRPMGNGRPKKTSVFRAALIFFLALRVPLAGAQDLAIADEDIRLEPVFDSASRVLNTRLFDTVAGYHLYIRKKPDIESVLLMDNGERGKGGIDKQALRCLEWNEVNGSELRYQEGRRLVSGWAKFSIVDSTPEWDAEFGEAFHLYIPRVMVYGHPRTKSGEISVNKGMTVNIRTFSLPYADDSGDFHDNPFVFGSMIIPAQPPAPKVKIPQSVTEPQGNPVHRVEILPPGTSPQAPLPDAPTPEAALPTIIPGTGAAPAAPELPVSLPVLPAENVPSLPGQSAPSLPGAIPALP